MISQAMELSGITLHEYVLEHILYQSSTSVLFQGTHQTSHQKVAIKVYLLPAAQDENAHQRYLENFTRELSSVASLLHPHILSIIAHGDIHGMPYCIMPYIEHGSLRTILDAQETLDNETLFSYAEQIGTALTHSHASGIFHTNLKPSNILSSSDGHLLVSDFALCQTQNDIKHSLAYMEPPYYMAPEIFLGEQPHETADVYSLGMLLYTLVTRSFPFQSISAARVVMEHLRTPVSHPSEYRDSFPIDAGYVILQAVSKRPTDRFATINLFLKELRQTLSLHAVQRTQYFEPETYAIPELEKIYNPKGLFNPVWQTAVLPAISRTSATSILPAIVPNAPVHPASSTQISPPSQTQNIHAASLFQLPFPSSEIALLDTSNATSLLPVYSGDTSPIRSILTTQLFPNTPLPSTTYWEKVQYTVQQQSTSRKIGIFLAILLFAILGITVYTHLHTTQPVLENTPQHVQSVQIANWNANKDPSNILLSDSLAQNIHNWTVSTDGSNTYLFKDGAYHISATSDNQDASALLSGLPDTFFDQPFGYMLTMQQISGDTTSQNNQYGLILRFHQDQQNGKTHTVFYSFEVVNASSGEYQFWKYDDSASGSPWTKVWHQSFSSEYHQGINTANTFKVYTNGSTFTFYVNGKQVGTATDTSIPSGIVGMLVNMKGAEVAFSNFLLTKK